MTTIDLLMKSDAVKSVSQMSDDEFEKAASKVIQEAKTKAFSKGLPVTFSKAGILYEKYEDGRTYQIHFTPDFQKIATLVNE